MACNAGLAQAAEPAQAPNPTQAQQLPGPAPGDETEIIRLMDIGKPAEARALAQRAHAQALKDWGERDPRSIELLALHSGTLIELGLPAEALALRDQALALRTSVHGADDPRTLEDGAMRLLSLAYLGRLQLTKTEGLALLARQQRVLGPQHPVALSTMMTLAAVLAWMGEWQEAMRIHELAYRTQAEVQGPLHANTLSAQANYSVALSELGRLDEAETMARAAWQGRLQTLGADHGDTALALSSYATMQRARGDLAAALLSFEQADASAQRTLGPRHPHSHLTRVNLAGGLIDTGKTEQGLELLAQLIADFESTGQQLNPYALRAHMLWGQALAKQGAWAQAQVHWLAASQGHAALGMSGAKNGRASLIGLAQSQAGLGDHAAAIDTLRGLVQLLETQGLHVNELTAAHKRDWLRSVLDGYQQLIGLLLAKNDAAHAQEAFRLSETVKARVLVEQMAQGDAAALAELPPADAESLRQKQAQLAEVSAMMARGASAEDRPQLLARAIGLSRELHQMREQLGAQFERYAQLTQAVFVGAQGGARLLSPQQRYLSFTVNAQQHVRAALLAPSGELLWLDLGVIENLDKDVEAVRMTAAGELRNSAAARKQAAALAQRLIQPLAPHLPPGAELLLSPDGPLWQLPWDALPGPDGKPWGLKVQTQQVHSLAVLQKVQQRLATRAKSKEERPSLLAFGAPNYPRADTGSTIRGRSRYSPLRAGQTAQDSVAALTALHWPRLPFAQLEMDRVSALFPPKNVRQISGDAATETSLRGLSASGELARYRYLLFSAHGYFDPNRPEFSSLVLKPEGTDTARDGFVSVPEWLPLRLNSELVALSACETARGSVVSGDGLVGLSYALFVAGNANTLATLWPVADRETALFVSQFFSRVRRGESHSRALVETKRFFLNHPNPRLRQPRHWAGFVLYGA